jgi:Uma2 family endonuclease
MTLETKKITYEEYLKMPETRARYDIVDGVMIMAAAPTLEHQRILRRLIIMVNQFVEDNGLGEVFFAPTDVVIQREPLRTRQPDLLVMGNQNTGLSGQALEAAPDLVVEILSPSNSRNEVQRKMLDYALIGVKEVWLISPEANTVEVLGFKQDEWIRDYLLGIGDGMQSSILEGFEIELSGLFSVSSQKPT